ncbi:MAG: hypothetical protein OXH47_02975, partial [Paracoccaceae bacterium]|nr:hypothetical protein [Paracoccaceae bacterium]
FSIFGYPADLLGYRYVCSLDFNLSSYPLYGSGSYTAIIMVKMIMNFRWESTHLKELKQKVLIRISY